MFEIGVLKFYYLHKIAKDKLKVLTGLGHVVRFLTNHLKIFAMRYCLVHLKKSNSEASTLLLLIDVSLKLCAADLFYNKPSSYYTSSSSSFVFFSITV